MRRRECVAMDWFPFSLRVASVSTSVESGERTTRLLRSNPGRSLYDEDTTESQGFYHDGAKTRKIAKILVAFELLGGLDAFHRGEESFGERQVDVDGAFQKRMRKPCEHQGDPVAHG